jgi:hypothetical protein
MGVPFENRKVHNAARIADSRGFWPRGISKKPDF